jgi:hypothetical protein
VRWQSIAAAAGDPCKRYLENHGHEQERQRQRRENIMTAQQMTDAHY